VYVVQKRLRGRRTHHRRALLPRCISLRAWHSVGMHGEMKQAMGWAKAGRAGSLKSVTQQQSPMQAGLRGSHA
jgi:hypothetical protein